MRLLVCVKQVIDIEQQMDIRADRRWIAENEDTRYHMNYYDEFAVEEAVRIKEKFGGVTIEALTMGPAEAESALRRALALGADTAVHIRYDDAGFLPAEETAFHIAEHIKAASYDLILCGVMSEDAMQSLTGPMLAARLGIPCATAVVGQEINPADGTVTVICELTGGLRETMWLPLPALLSVQSGINQPRYASLSNRLRAKSQAIRTIPADRPCRLEQRQHGLSVFVPAKKGSGEFLAGSAEQKAGALIDILHKKSLI